TTVWACVREALTGRRGRHAPRQSPRQVSAAGADGRLNVAAAPAAWRSRRSRLPESVEAQRIAKTPSQVDAARSSAGVSDWPTAGAHGQLPGAQAAPAPNTGMRPQAIPARKSSTAYVSTFPLGHTKLRVPSRLLRSTYVLPRRT